MYRAKDMWEEAFRVARNHGPEVSLAGARKSCALLRLVLLSLPCQVVANQVAFLWVASGTLPEAMIVQIGLVAPAVAHATEHGEWEVRISTRVRFPFRR